MKPSTHSARKHRTTLLHGSREKGFTLILVLSIVLLMAALSVGYLSMVRTELATSEAQALTTDLTLLADSTVNLVQAQITAAASEGSASSPVAWITQPGLARTFGPSGPSTAYKLYSWDNLIDATGSFDPQNDAPPASWDDDTAHFVDLNEPVAGNYPIAVPPTTNSPPGYAVDNSDGAVAGKSNPLPMPVKWLYFLENGQIVAPTSSAGDVATFSTSDVPADGSNPIVGRIAFWTDDETSKVNINTASEGVFWDEPRAEGVMQRLMGENQPIQDEFNRFPGHPATTSLSAVLPQLDPGRISPVGTLPAWGNSLGTPDGYLDNLETALSLNPRIGDGVSWWNPPNPNAGGSRGGSRPVAASQVHEIVPDVDPLYASVDEFALADDRSLRPAAVLPLETDGTAVGLDQAKFLLTASSRAPETNLFGLPRISLWPIHTESAKQDAFDELFAFTSTLETVGSGLQPYYFQRQNPWSATDDYSNIPRNQDLYQYLRTLTSTALPGFGGNFQTKFGNAQNRDQVLTMMFDYIRSGPNLYGAANSFNGYTPPPIDGDLTNLASVVMPIEINAGAGVTRGYGSDLPKIKQAILLLLPEGMNADANNVEYTFRPYIAFEFYSPSLKWSFKATALKIRINQSGNFSPSVTVNPPPGASLDGSPAPFVAFEAEYDGSSGSDPSFAPRSNNEVLAIGFQQSENFATGLFSPSWMFETDLDESPENGNTYNFITTDQTWTFTAPRPSGWPTPTDNPDDPDEATPSDMFSENPTVIIDEAPASSEDTLTAAGDSPGFRLDVSAFDLTVDLLMVTPGGDDVVIEEEIEISFPAMRMPVPYAHDSNWADEITTFNDSDPEPVPWGGLLAKDNIEKELQQFGLFAKSSVMNESGVPTRALDLDVGNDLKGDLRLSYLREDGDYEPTFGSTFWSDPNRYNAAESSWQANNEQMMAGNFSDNGHWGNSTRNLLGKPMLQNSGNSYRLDFFGILASGPRTLRIHHPAGATMSDGIAGDWSNVSGRAADGWPISAVHQGTLGALVSGGDQAKRDRRSSFFADSLVPTEGNNPDPLFSSNQQQYAAAYNPNRQMTSAVQFGSLPRRPLDDRPWETLLFCPNPAAGTAAHPGAVTPPDHLLADLFWMPIAEPYAISERFSTAGKINLNYQIAPFGYLERETGLRSLLKAQEITAIPDQSYNGALAHSLEGANDPPADLLIRYPVNADETLDEFDSRFANNQPFISPTEISEMYLFPEDSGGDPLETTVGALQTWWNSASGGRYTGDNTREAPYNDLLPRVTTRSNTFTVHYRVQVLRKADTAAAANSWDEEIDRVVGERRGAVLIERYIDPNRAVPDYAGASSLAGQRPLSEFYRWRIVQDTHFSPR